MNPFEHPELVAGYEAWYASEGRRADRLEKALLASLLNRFPTAQTILEIGCGTGHFTRWFEEQGLHATGVDASSAMLEEAIRRGTQDYRPGNAQDLPCDENAFDLAVFITALEFLDDPKAALREAARVARQGVLLGVLNARSLLGRQYRQEGGPVWEAAHFYTVRELRALVEDALGVRSKIVWRTTLWPHWPGALPLPWGGFIGMAVPLT